MLPPIFRIRRGQTHAPLLLLPADERTGARPSAASTSVSELLIVDAHWDWLEFFIEAPKDKIAHTHAYVQN